MNDPRPPRPPAEPGEAGFPVKVEKTLRHYQRKASRTLRELGSPDAARIQAVLPDVAAVTARMGY